MDVRYRYERSAIPIPLIARSDVEKLCVSKNVVGIDHILSSLIFERLNSKNIQILLLIHV